MDAIAAPRVGPCVLALALLLVALVAGAAPAPAVREVIALVDAGRFADADRRIASAMANDAPATLRDALAFERERMRRIRMDFTLDEAAVRAALRRAIPDLTEGEFAAWDRPRLLEQLTIDGEKRYFARAVPNLFRVHPPAAARRADPSPWREGPLERLHPHHREVVEAARASGSGSVAPRRVRVLQTLTVDADAVPAGEAIRAWIPFPRALPGQQEGIRLLATEPAQHILAPEGTLQRTVSMERQAVAGEPTRFSVSYELTVLARYHALDPARITPGPARPDEAEALLPFLAEEPPHVVFTEALRQRSRELVGDATHPYEVARRLFAGVDAIPWGSAREYSTIANISDYALHAGHADCGQQTLLLIALLRLNGIPARWQSGMVFSDGDYDNLHDWAQVYFAPYGWVPMDVTTGQLDCDDPALRWFYLGGQDAYRIAFNDAISTPFVPPKAHVRSETVDSQRGEAEWRGGNLYFDQWDYTFEARVVEAPRAP